MPVHEVIPGTYKLISYISFFKTYSTGYFRKKQNKTGYFYKMPQHKNGYFYKTTYPLSIVKLAGFSALFLLDDYSENLNSFFSGSNLLCPRGNPLGLQIWTQMCWLW